MLGFVLSFLNIGTPELMLILLVALMLFGGEKLPELARGLGKGIRDFKDASEGVKREINNQINNFEEKASSEPDTPPVVNQIAEETATTEPAKPLIDTNPTTEPAKPLIDTNPVVGTTPLGGTVHQAEHTEEHHISPEEQKITQG